MHDTLVITKEKSRTGVRVDEPNHLILFNDNYNTFDHVILSLIEVCHMDPVQAEQSVLIAHYKGKCSIKRGAKPELKPMCRALVDRGLTTEVH